MDYFFEIILAQLFGYIAVAIWILNKELSEHSSFSIGDDKAEAKGAV